MGVAVLVLGESGSGKSASMRNFKQSDVSVVAFLRYQLYSAQTAIVKTHRAYNNYL
mgnify:CR=1 FL=1